MRKDIFIDSNIASRFTNPMDPEYIKLIQWLMKYDANDIDNNAHLVISNKILKEYLASSRNANTETCIPVLIELLRSTDRLVNVSNKRIKNFKRKHYSKKVRKNLLCNQSDRDHLPAVLLSYRKYALAIDDNFIYDLLNFPGFKVIAAKRPEFLPYTK